MLRLDERVRLLNKGLVVNLTGRNDQVIQARELISLAELLTEEIVS